jgi:hypothetical protein
MTTRLSLTATPGRPYAVFVAKAEAVALSVMTLKGLDALTGDDLLMVGVAIYHGKLRDIGTHTHAQIDAHIDSVWAKNTANGVTLLDGPPTSSDTVADLQTAFDGSTYTVDEASANAGQNLVVDFAGVTAFNWVRIIGNYSGQASHELQIQLEITPFDDSVWHSYKCIVPSLAYTNDYSFFVSDDAVYINAGVVKVKVLHPNSGNSNDEWIFEEIALYQ